MSALPTEIDESSDTTLQHGVIWGLFPKKLLADAKFLDAVDGILSGDPHFGDQPVQLTLLFNSPFFGRLTGAMVSRSG